MKFNASGKTKFAVLDFIKKVNNLAKAQNVSQGELFASSYHLFEGNGELWYAANAPYVNTWQALVDRLKAHFLPADYEFELTKEIMTRKQAEPFILYHAKMEQLFQSCPVSFSEAERLTVLQKNLDPEYQRNLMRFKPDTIQDLIAACKEVEAFLGDDFWKKKGRRERVSELELKDEEEAGTSEEAHVEAIRRMRKPVKPVAASGQTAVRDRKFVCWNCDSEGHSFRTCEAEKKLFCFGCGKKNVTVKKCDKCNQQENL